MPDGDGACAAVLYSHGLGGNRQGGDVWGTAWREAGFAVLHVQHPGSDSAIWQAGVGALRAAASAEQLGARIADMKFVLDEIARRAAAGDKALARIRLDAVGAAGHSFGARVVQALAGQRFPVAGVPSWVEKRFKAFVALSPSLGGSRSDPRTAFGSIGSPFLSITGSLDQDPLGSDRTGEHRLAVYEGMPTGMRALLWLDGADHLTFGGNAPERMAANRRLLQRPAGTEQREAAHHAAVARISTAWWRAHLLGVPDALAPTAITVGLGPADQWRAD
jgi:predicted dienelactone hydrolase